MRLLFLFNYAPNGTSVTRYCGLKVYKSNPTVTKLYRKTLGSEAGSTRNRDLVIDSNGDIMANDLFVDGNVGIGTTSPPTYKLDVSSTSAVGARISTSGFTNLDLVSNRTSGNLGGLRFKQDIDAAQTGEFLGLHGGGFDWKVGNGTAAPGIKMRLDSSGNLGIGTTSPDSKLGISVTPAAAWMNLINGDETAFRLTTYNNGTNNGSSSYAFKHGLYHSTTENAAVTFWRGGSSVGGFLTFTTNNGSERMRIDGSGNVGIGTTIPGEKLTVSGNGRFSNGSQGTLTIKHNYGYLQPNWGIKLDGDTNTSGGYLSQYVNIGGFALNQGGTYYGGGPHRTDANSTSFSSVTGVNGEIRFHTNTSLTANTSFFPSERMRIDTSGNVGIGTTSPTQHQSSTETVLHIGNSNVASLNLDSGGTNGDCYVLSSTASGNFMIYNDDNNSYPFNIDDADNVGIGTTTPNAKLDVQGTQGQLFSVTDDLSGDIFSVADISGVPIMNVNSDGTSYFDGNVGIGTINPSYKLEVSSPNNSVLKLINTEANYGANQQSILFQGVWWSGNPGAITNIARIAGTHRSDGYHSGGLNFYTYNNGTELNAMTMQYDGNVGIGTTNPNTKLVVTQSANNSSPAIIVNNASNGVDGYTFQSWRYVESSTSFRLDLKQRVSSGIVKYAFDMVNNGTGYNSTLVLDRGNVGIGTDSPGAKLDVNGDIVISDSGDRVFTTDSVNGAFSLGDIDAIADEAVVQGDGSFIFLKNAGNTTLTTTVDNRVGIGTSAPGSKLDIVGTTNESNSSLLRVRTTDNPNAPEKVVGFYVNTNTERGFISVNQYSTAYSTSSDYRLKENIAPISNGIERLKELKPCRFNFIQGDPNYVVDGFIAHEAAEVIPEAVTGEKDAVDENNNPLYQGIDQSKVVPLLTAALQEAINKIEQLETRIQTLENN